MEILQDIPILNTLATWVEQHIINIVLILLGGALIKRFGLLPLEGFLRRTIKTSRFQTEEQHLQREETLLEVARSVFNVFVAIIVIILLLLEIDINLQPFLAAGGALGLIIGFGAQNILKDLFAGLYVITENQYQIGDIIDIDGDVGVVEDITLRAVSLRDLDGTVHHIPHGGVQRTSNLSKDYARVNTDIGVAYDTDLDEAIEVINAVGKELAGDEEWKHLVLTPPKFLRVDNFGDSSIELKVLGETKAGNQWAVMGEFRKRLKSAFDQAGIEIPFPQRVIHNASSEKTGE